MTDSLDFVGIDFDYFLTQHLVQIGSDMVVSVRCCVRTITSLMLLLGSETDENVLLLLHVAF